MPHFVVKTLPNGATGEFDAGDVLAAADMAREAHGPSNEALLFRTDAPRVNGANFAKADARHPTRVTWRDHPAAVHFVGFKEFDQTYNNAVRVFGKPDFFHTKWDERARREIAPWDTLVFARGDATDTPQKWSVDDSSEPHDPAEQERRSNL